MTKARWEKIGYSKCKNWVYRSWFYHLSSPHSSPSCTPPSFYPPAPGTWWWWEPQRCWQRRKGTRQSRWRRRWTSPSCCRGSDLCPPLSHPQSVAAPWQSRETALIVWYSSGALRWCRDCQEVFVYWGDAQMLGRKRNCFSQNHQLLPVKCWYCLTGRVYKRNTIELI